MTVGASNSDVALVGMSCRFAGAADLRAFWHNILQGIGSIGDSSDAEAPRFRDPDTTLFERVPTLRGGYLGDLWRFEHAPHGVPAEAVRGADPGHFLALDLATQALREAGYAERSFPRDRTAVILGYAASINPATVGWIQRGLVVDQTLDLVRRLFPHGTPEHFARLRDSLRLALPDYDSRNVPGLLPNTLTGRIANRFDLHGAHYVVDASCASALVALCHAVDELRTNRADLVLTGAVQGVLSPQWLMPFARLGLLSRHPEPHPFHRDADGTLFGEGGAILVLKRRADAERDGDRIYALIRSVGLAGDGHGRALLTPSEDAHQQALLRAYSQAGVPPSSVGLIEAHGTGIPLWDRIEAHALGAVFGARQGRWPSTALGSVKSMVGHCATAAGAAGLAKAALGLYHRILPPTLNSDRPHPSLHLSETPFYLNPNARPWIHSHAQPRRAGVSAIGFGGIHAHVVLEEFPESV